MTYSPAGKPASKADIADVKSALNELRAEIGGLRSSIKSDLAGLRLGSKSDLQQMENRLSARFDRVETRLNSHEVRFGNDHEAIRHQTRTFVLAITGSMVALSGIAIGAAALI